MIRISMPVSGSPSSWAAFPGKQQPTTRIMIAKLGVRVWSCGFKLGLNPKRCMYSWVRVRKLVVLVIDSEGHYILWDSYLGLRIWMVNTSLLFHPVTTCPTARKEKSNSLQP